MIERVLITNRGECARRIAHTVRELGKTPIVVYTDDDTNSLHVKEAEEAHEIRSYTHIGDIMKVARISETDAIHPGWGYNAENPKFVEACEKAGIKFIGPTEDAMRNAGNKETAKQICKKLLIPVPPSTPNKIKRSEIRGWTSRHGLSNDQNSIPMMLKAARAGGGSGNRVVSRLEDLEQALEAVSRTSRRLWGRSRILVERLVPNARHVEVQLLGDEHGNRVHLGLRDCTGQWNHQKVIEEAPAPFLTLEQEKLLFEYALGFGEVVGYSSAGTAEFLISPKEGILFIEFNPRLQVEHGVTEIITNLDLVKLQILIAEGNTLPFAQQEIDFYGTAIEARVNVHPSGGIVKEVIFPEGKNIRVDHALYDGYEVNPNYNPTQAKVIAWNSTREGAINVLRKALSEFGIAGVETNIPLILSVLSDSRFVEGKHTTISFEEKLKEMVNTNGGKPEDKEKAAAIGVAIAIALQGQQKRQEEVVVFSRDSSLWRQAGRIEQTRGLDFRGRR